MITEKQRWRLVKKAEEFKWEDADVKTLIAEYGYKDSSEIEAWQDYPQIIEAIEAGPENQKAGAA